MDSAYLKLFTDPEMTPEKYKSKWLEELKNTPMGKLVKKLTEKGAELMSTEINDKKFVLSYLETWKKTMVNPLLYVGNLNALDEEREKYISKNIDQTLKERGVLLIGRWHIGKFKFADDIEVLYI